jgi:hypothetical protein
MQRKVACQNWPVSERNDMADRMDYQSTQSDYRRDHQEMDGPLLED